MDLTHATGLLAPSHDFGLTPLEANARGLPVVAQRAAGYLDTIDDGLSGILFTKVTPEAICAAVQAACSHTWHAEAIREHEATFDEPSSIKRSAAM